MCAKEGPSASANNSIKSSASNQRNAKNSPTTKSMPSKTVVVWLFFSWTFFFFASRYCQNNEQTEKGRNTKTKPSARCVIVVLFGERKNKNNSPRCTPLRQLWWRSDRPPKNIDATASHSQSSQASSSGSVSRSSVCLRSNEVTNSSSLFKTRPSLLLALKK